ncbi:MAG: hypothetical protein HYR62_07640 [Actinobacteria bacterium]|nr:hypothetical protein [Actinomycetota bacterium]MBI3686556.1 hypothetical protein [Actinomycetota bacterium]
MTIPPPRTTAELPPDPSGGPSADRQAPQHGAATFYDPDRHPWPPNAAQVRLFVLALALLGLPLAWWAVSR